MEARLNMVVYIGVLFVAAMLHGSSAQQTTHVVGDSLGWIVPPGGDIAYRTWAASRTFNVGDSLVFNYNTGLHDVAEVSRSAYDSCNATNPISMATNGPTTITLTSSGERHFICTFGRHCDFGQKLSINVSAAASTAPPPQAATPPPAPTPETTPSPAVPAAPAPSPSAPAMTYVVGDSLGWVVPPGGPVAYRTWAMGKSFVVGDILVFNFTNGLHDVAEVTKAEFDSCNVTTTTTPPIFTGPARITLASAGEHYYICTFSQHCFFGQKLAINVTGGSTVAPPTGSAPAPSSMATPPSATTPPPSSATPPPSSGGAMPPTSTPSTPSTPMAPPPPSNSAAPSFAAAVLPVSFLAIAVAFLLN